MEGRPIDNDEFDDDLSTPLFEEFGISFDDLRMPDELWEKICTLIADPNTPLVSASGVPGADSQADQTLPTEQSESTQGNVDEYHHHHSTSPLLEHDLHDDYGDHHDVSGHDTHHDVGGHDHGHDIGGYQ
ncbi:hypothetical protein GOEFS_051_00110 [Gordonia effusa NBRC 100432]|uniref:Uncharacterized protein n=1 Tax=Gordonia effusa NBRC 100432 TaxID=1077974 RepID=H0QZR5_9ACTN|nr:hypothetical protein GOEFS_051_00110 [Gordonia effusa NBRC 100432]